MDSKTIENLLFSKFDLGDDDKYAVLLTKMVDLETRLEAAEKKCAKLSKNNNNVIAEMKKMRERLVALEPVSNDR